MPPILHLPLDILTIFLLVLAWTSMGLRWLRTPFTDEWMRRFMACGLGLSCFIYSVFLISVLGWLNTPVVLSLVAVFLLIGLKPLMDSLKRINGMAFLKGLQNLSTFEKSLLGILLISAVTHLLFGYAPPTADDEMVYQISLPRLYATAGALVNTPDHFGSFYPLNAQLLFSAVLLLRGVLAVKVLVWSFGLLVGAVFAYFASTQLRLERRCTLITLALFYTMPYMTSIQGTCSSDLISIFFGLLATVLFWQDKNDKTRLILLGIYAGTSMGTRYYAAAWVLAIALALVIFNKKYKGAFFFLVVAGLLFAPWPLRNLILTGNPFYPKVLWPGLAQNPYFIATTVAYALTPLWITFCLIPIQLPYGSVIWGMGILPAAIAPFAFFDDKDRSHVKRLLFLAAATIVFTFVFPYRMDRYFGQGLVYVALLAGMGWRQLSIRMVAFKRTLLNSWLMAVLLVPNLFLSSFFGFHRLPYLIGQQSEADYLTRYYTVCEGYPVIRYIHENIPKSSRLLFLGPQQGFYFYYPDWPLVDMIHFSPAFYNQSTERLAAGFDQAGIHTVVFVRRCFKPNRDGSWNWWSVKSSLAVNLPALNPPFFRERFRSDSAIVYEVVSKRILEDK